MARNSGLLVLASVLLASIVSICNLATIFTPISHSHRSAELELFSPSKGSFGSLKETYEALTTFEILGIEKEPLTRTSVCTFVADTLSSTLSSLKDLFQALRVNGILKCELKDKAFVEIVSRLKDSVNSANSLLDYNLSILTHYYKQRST